MQAAIVCRSSLIDRGWLAHRAFNRCGCAQAGVPDRSGEPLRVHLPDAQRLWARVRAQRAGGDAPRIRQLRDALHDHHRRSRRRSLQLLLVPRRPRLPPRCHLIGCCREASPEASAQLDLTVSELGAHEREVLQQNSELGAHEWELRQQMSWPSLVLLPSRLRGASYWIGREGVGRYKCAEHEGHAAEQIAAGVRCSSSWGGHALKCSCMGASLWIQGGRCHTACLHVQAVARLHSINKQGSLTQAGPAAVLRER